MLVVALGTWGFTVIGTMFSALTVNIRLREVMLPMLTYPILVEPNLTNRAQAWMWSIAYATFVVVCGTVSYMSRGSGDTVRVRQERLP